MDVVSHQRIGMNGAAVSASRLVQPMEITEIVFIGKKARLAVDAALNNVQRVASEQNAGAAGHDFDLVQKTKCL